MTIDDIKFSENGWDDPMSMWWFDMIVSTTYTGFFFHVSFNGRTLEQIIIKHRDLVRKMNSEL